MKRLEEGRERSLEGRWISLQPGFFYVVNMHETPRRSAAKGQAQTRRRCARCGWFVPKQMASHSENRSVEQQVNSAVVQIRASQLS